MGGRGSQGGRGRGRIPYPPCSHCGNTNHTPHRCWKKWGKPAYVNQASISATSDDISARGTPPRASTHVTVTREEYDHLISQLSHSSAQPSTSTATLTHTGTAHGLVAHQPSSSWVIDSGASHHMSGMSSLFSDFHPPQPKIRCVMADGSTRDVLGQGDIPATSDISLSSVLFVPSFPFNLLSVSQLTKTLNCSMTFYPSSCIIQDLKTGQKIGGGSERGGLYYLDQELLQSTGVALHIRDSPVLWHRCLGHPSLRILHKTVPSLDPQATLQCEACQLGKHHRSIFSRSQSTSSSSAFELVYLDVWGPARHRTTNGHLYYVVFVDDFSWMT